MPIPFITQVKDVKGKRVLVRADFDIGTDKSGKKIVDDIRIRENLPTIKWLLAKGAKVICVAKRRRPKGKRDPLMSMKIVVKRLKEYLPDYQIILVDDFLKPTKVFENQTPNQILVLENIRYYPEEEQEDEGFAQKLAVLADIYVSDAFACVHRPDTSVFVVPKFLPSYAGFLLKKEIDGLDTIMRKPKRPFVAMLGGVKIETKLPVIKNLLPIVDVLLVGGGIVNTYLSAVGYGVGESLIDAEYKKQAVQYAKKKKVILPVDVVVGDAKGKTYRVVRLQEKPHRVCKKGEAIFDIGPETIRLYSNFIKKAKTILWNGALGYFEQPPYNVGTCTLAWLIGTRSKGKAFGVIGGGETIQAMEKVGMLLDIDFVSTGGGAMLEYLSGKKLPGIVALEKSGKKKRM